MRQIGTVSSAHAARTFADYLASLKIEARLDHQGQIWALWVCDEDRVKQAQQELADFLRNPADPRFARPAKPAATPPPPPVVEAEEETSDEAAAPVRPQDRQVWRRLVTIGLLAGCMSVFLATDYGEASSPLLQMLQIAPDGDPTLTHVFHGEVWRLVTPIFLHFGFLHLLFNVLMLLDLGRQVELRRGPVRYVLLVLIVAVCANVAQFYLGQAVFSVNTGFVLNPSGSFGGMSGVLYGLFGYMWVKSRYEPALGLEMTPSTVVLMIGWLFLCMFDVIVPVANVAHAFGLFSGLVLGYAGYLSRIVRQRWQ